MRTAADLMRHAAADFGLRVRSRPAGGWSGWRDDALLIVDDDGRFNLYHLSPDDKVSKRGSGTGFGDLCRALENFARPTVKAAS